MLGSVLIFFSVRGIRFPAKMPKLQKGSFTNPILTKTTNATIETRNTEEQRTTQCTVRTYTEHIVDTYIYLQLRSSSNTL